MKILEIINYKRLDGLAVFSRICRGLQGCRLFVWLGRLLHGLRAQGSPERHMHPQAMSISPSYAFPWLMVTSRGTPEAVVPKAKKFGSFLRRRRHTCMSGKGQSYIQSEICRTSLLLKWS
jgi:hypothetical protein